MKVRNIEEISMVQNLDFSSKSLFLDDINLQSLMGIEKFTDLEWLRITNSKIFDLRILENLTSLRKINVMGNSIACMDGLENLVNLEHLNLGENKISEIKNISRLQSLRTLNLCENAIIKKDGRRIFTCKEMTELIKKDLPNLEYLNLFRNPLMDKWNLEMLNIDHKIYFVKDRKFLISENDVKEAIGKKEFDRLVEKYIVAVIGEDYYSKECSEEENTTIYIEMWDETRQKIIDYYEKYQIFPNFSYFPDIDVLLKK